MNDRIERHEQIDIDGITLHALVRGAADGPMVLLVQAGPGFPMIHESRALEANLDLESTHRVVYLDQRGTGLSLAPNSPLSIDRLTADILAVVKALTERYGVSAIDLVGFSLGGTLAILAAQKDPRAIRSVTAVGPDIDVAASEFFAWRFVEEQALRRGLHSALTRARAAQQVTSNDPSGAFATRVRLVTDLGGIAIGQTFFRMVAQTIYRLFASPWYSFLGVLRALIAMQSTQQQLLSSPSFVALDLRSVNALEVPIAIFQGRLDAAAPPQIAHEFFDALSAPKKQFIWFDECAHMPHFEAPAAFRSALANALG